MGSHGPTLRIHVLAVAKQSSPRASRWYTTTVESQAALPSIAPRPHIDIKRIRQDPDFYSQNCINRNYKPLADSPFKIVKLFDQWRELQEEGRSLRQRNNTIRTQLSHAKTFSGIDPEETPVRRNDEDALQEARDLKQEISKIEEQEDLLNTEMEDLAATMPNSISQETPIGDDPKVLRTNHLHLEQDRSPSSLKDHVHIGRELDLLDFAGAAMTTGWGWYYLKNEAVLLEQALIQYALSVGMRRGFTVVSPPSMVYSHITSACGFRPRDQNGESQVYKIQKAEKDVDKDRPELSMAGTAEIPFAGMKANAIFEESELPLKVIGSSRCYRAEAGARGIETKGLYRVHEFTKVEMFAWTSPDDSADKLFLEMTGAQEDILQGLGLGYRVLEMPSTDLGASASRKVDIEAFFPSRMERSGGWGEVTSTSNCTDYQTRRLGTRVRRAEGQKHKIDFPYTVNGTALAVPRIIAALLENGWDEDEGYVAVPKVLWPWMHGVESIKKRRGFAA